MPHGSERSGEEEGREREVDIKNGRRKPDSDMQTSGWLALACVRDIGPLGNRYEPKSVYDDCWFTDDGCQF